MTFHVLCRAILYGPCYIKSFFPVSMGLEKLLYIKLVIIFSGFIYYTNSIPLIFYNSMDQRVVNETIYVLLAAK